MEKKRKIRPGPQYKQSLKTVSHKLIELEQYNGCGDDVFDKTNNTTRLISYLPLKVKSKGS